MLAQLNDPRGLSKRARAASEAYQDAIRKTKQASQRQTIVELQNADLAATSDQTGSLDSDLYRACLRLTLEAEIAADMASPAADQADRMALQVEFMNQGIRDLGTRDHQELIARWTDLGPKTQAENQLRERFFAALAHRFSS